MPFCLFDRRGSSTELAGLQRNPKDDVGSVGTEIGAQIPMILNCDEFTIWDVSIPYLQAGRTVS